MSIPIDLLRRIDALERELERLRMIEVANGPIHQLHYIAAADLINGATVSPANTWVDVTSDQTFAVSFATSIVAIAARGFVLAGGVAAANVVSSRLAVDVGGTPVLRMLGGDGNQTVNVNEYGNAMAGAGLVTFAGLSAGNHTVRVQFTGSANNIKGYCLPSTLPSSYSLAIVVVEYPT